MIGTTQRILGYVVGIAFVVVMLEGCNETVDARQLQKINGLIYKLNSSEPFTGTVINYKEFDEFTRYEEWNCEVHFKKGELHGPFNCVSIKTGVKTGEKTYDHNAKTGLETVWSNDGELVSKTEWTGGRRNGLAEVYHPKTGKLLAQRHWVNGVKVGEEKELDVTGSVLLTSLNWQDGQATGFIKNKDEEHNYKNGLRHGYQRVYRLTADGIDEDLAASREVLYIAKGGKYFYGMFKGAYIMEEELYDNDVLVSSKRYDQPPVNTESTGSSTVENEKNTDFD